MSHMRSHMCRHGPLCLRSWICWLSEYQLVVGMLIIVDFTVHMYKCIVITIWLQRYPLPPVAAGQLNHHLKLNKLHAVYKRLTNWLVIGPCTGVVHANPIPIVVRMPVCTLPSWRGMSLLPQRWILCTPRSRMTPRPRSPRCPAMCRIETLPPAKRTWIRTTCWRRKRQRRVDTQVRDWTQITLSTARDRRSIPRGTGCGVALRAACFWCSRWWLVHSLPLSLSWLCCSPSVCGR